MTNGKRYKPDRKKRNEEIRRRFDELTRQSGLQSCIAKNELAKEFQLAYTTIENIIYRSNTFQ